MDRKILKLDGLLLPIEDNDLHIDEVINSPYVYEEQLVKLVTPTGTVFSSNAQETMRGLIVEFNSVKIEGMEKLSAKLLKSCRRAARVIGHRGPVTCHVFLAQPGSHSFPMHTDPDDVVLYVVDGEKTIAFGEGEITLKAGESLFIPYNTPHRAINREASLMLSFGLERYIKEKLWECSEQSM